MSSMRLETCSKQFMNLLKRSILIFSNTCFALLARFLALSNSSEVSMKRSFTPSSLQQPRQSRVSENWRTLRNTYRWSRAQTIQVWTGIFFRTMIKTIKHIGHKTSISVGRLDAAQNVYLSRTETCCFRTWTDCATNLKGQWSWMVWADDEFSYFDWLNRLAKFRHGVLPDHVSFCGNLLLLKIRS